MIDDDDDDLAHVRWWDDFEITGKTEATREKQRAEYLARLEKLYQYCRTDVEAERLAETKLYPLSPSERQVYLLDQTINDRGISVDLETTRMALELVEKAGGRLNERIAKITNGLVTTINQRDKMIQWFGMQGSHFTSLDKQGIVNALKDTSLPPQVREVLEIRQIGAKSSTKKLQAILNMADSEGRIHGNLLYHGASTGRFSGKGVQLQNLPRPEILKEPEDAIPYIKKGDIDLIEMCFGPVQTVAADVIRSLVMAAEGKVLYAADFAAIEARVLAWLAGQQDLVDQFANGDDVYLSFAGTVYGRKLNKKEHPRERQLGKACLAAGTLVFTDHGLVPIEQVTFDIKVWDGEEWVSHLGVLSNGIKKTLNLSGVWLTQDHRVLCGERWMEAQQLDWDFDLKRRALETAKGRLPSPDISSAGAEDSRRSLSSATVWIKSIESNQIRSREEEPHVVRFAGTQPPLFLKPELMATEQNARTLPIGHDCSRELRGLYVGAATQKIHNSTTTAGVGLMSTNRGSRTKDSFFDTSSLSTTGTFLSSNWIVSITNKGMCRVICGSCHAAKTYATDVKCPKCKREFSTWKPVYDIVNAGPRNRFMVLTKDGPLLVHNCLLGLGFGMGAPKFEMTIAKDQIFLPEGEAQRVVKLYRDTYSLIPKFWYALERAAMRAISNPNSVVTLRNMKFRMRDGNLRLLLPSGRALNYPEARVCKVKTPWGEMKNGVEISAVNALTRKWERTTISPGTFTENVVQAVSRDLMISSMFRLEEHNYPVLLTVHDEVVSEVDEGYGSVAEYEALVAATPDWAAGLPVKAEGWSGKRYRK